MNFVRSCYACQLCAKSRLIMIYSPSWSTNILRKFHLDTIFLPKAYNGMCYVLKAIEPVISWAEAYSVDEVSDSSPNKHAM